MLILNNQQNANDEQLAQERARTAAAEQAASQPTQQQPPIIVTPQTQPSTIPVPVPVPAPSQPAPSTVTPTNTQLEVQVNSKFLDDQDLRKHPLDVKVIGGTAVLSGSLPSNELKARAEELARTVQGVKSVMNSIIVKPEYE